MRLRAGGTLEATMWRPATRTTTGGKDQVCSFFKRVYVCVSAHYDFCACVCVRLYGVKPQMFGRSRALIPLCGVVDGSDT